MVVSIPVLPESTYDIIFAGGGTAACVAAGRLAQSAPQLQILILEAGPDTKDNLAHIQPARYVSHMSPNSKTVQVHLDKPTEALGSRQAGFVCGRCLGGGSSVNWAMYTRGSKSDYDAWRDEFHNTGWGFDDLLPLFKKTETFHPTAGLPTHGNDGPLGVSYGGTYFDIGKQFIELAGQIDKNRKADELFDSNDFSSTNVYCRWPKWIDGNTGKRSDVVHNYIYNQHHPNLRIATGASVKRVLLENGLATGVEFHWNDCSPFEDRQKLYTVKAVMMVVVSAGAFGSPAILERSGIGSKTVLENVGVEQIIDLDGVGVNYQDHNIVLTPYYADDDAETLDGIIQNEAREMSAASAEWTKTGQGRMATNGVDVAIKYRPTTEELEQWGLEWKMRWEEDFANKSDKPVMWVGQCSMLLGNLSIRLPTQKYFCIGGFTLYPVARGYVHISSGQNTEAPLDFKSGFFENISDIVPHMWVYKYYREFARRMPVFRGEPAVGHPRFPEGSEAAVVEHGEPFPLDAPTVKYSAEDDRAIEEHMRAEVGTSWHGLGTCSMKPKDQGGVVDSLLNVYGVSNLKVADMSICPGNIGGNTYSTALVIGEKAAEIILKELETKILSSASTDISD
ncbi:hypothetical protein GYMLUDRAFT_48302 [Collybiopsis luxurians FD-317 M1]|uniref:Glucose-methanol-choline oxidoreductase N-terminal domain-containing protein n=1 Tax=Collybiopsis luxurians FD-317 M1 TaxID=944289 RepID=A0A0D0BJL7_9AGAR|nr:hypothetical protein GYMLUDRAFT_48302 [Collybiopsis luxurians FD-317 M1]